MRDASWPLCRTSQKSPVIQQTDEPKAHALNLRNGSSPAWAETKTRGVSLEPGPAQPEAPKPKL